MIALREAMKLLAAINLQDHLVQLRQSTCILIVDDDNRDSGTPFISLPLRSR